MKGAVPKKKKSGATASRNEPPPTEPLKFPQNKTPLYFTLVSIHSTITSIFKDLVLGKLSSSEAIYAIESELAVMVMVVKHLDAWVNGNDVVETETKKPNKRGKVCAIW